MSAVFGIIRRDDRAPAAAVALLAARTAMASLGRDAGEQQQISLWPRHHSRALVYNAEPWNPAGSTESPAKSS